MGDIIRFMTKITKNSILIYFSKHFNFFLSLKTLYIYKYYLMWNTQYTILYNNSRDFNNNHAKKTLCSLVKLLSTFLKLNSVL